MWDIVNLVLAILNLIIALVYFIRDKYPEATFYLVMSHMLFSTIKGK